MADNQAALDLLGSDLPDLLQRVGDEVPDARWPQVLADLVDVAEAALVKGGYMSRETARGAARFVVAAQAEYVGAQPIYLPRGDSLRVALEHCAIWQAWDGAAATKYRLAREYRASVRTIERIIREQSALHRRRFQGRLFD